MTHVFIVQSRDGAGYVQAFADAEAFIGRYDADGQEEDPALTLAYREAVTQAERAQGTSVDIGDGDTLTLVEVVG